MQKYGLKLGNLFVHPCISKLFFIALDKSFGQNNAFNFLSLNYIFHFVEIALKPSDKNSIEPLCAFIWSVQNTMESDIVQRATELLVCSCQGCLSQWRKIREVPGLVTAGASFNVSWWVEFIIEALEPISGSTGHTAAGQLLKQGWNNDKKAKLVLPFKATVWYTPRKMAEFEGVRVTAAQ